MNWKFDLLIKPDCFIYHFGLAGPTIVLENVFRQSFHIVRPAGGGGRRGGEGSLRFW